MHAFGMRGRVPPVANSLAPLGDSRIQGIAFDGTTTNWRFQQENYLNCANMLGGQFFTYTGNWGVNGSTTTGMLSRLSAALASRPAFLAILGGVNDPGFGIPRSTTLSNLLAMADAAVAAGVRPILHTDWGSQGFAPTLCAEWQAFNDGVRAYCARTPRAILADLVPALLSSTNPIAFKPGHAYDGTHLDTPGAMAAGAAFAAQVAPLLPPPPDPPLLGGNLVTNAAFAGTGGAVGTGNTGVMPSSFTAGRDNTNCAAALSINAREDGVNEVVMAITTANSGTAPAGAAFRQFLNFSGPTAGLRFVCGCQMDIDAGHASLGDVRVGIDVSLNDASSLQAYGSQASNGRTPFEPGALSLVLRTGVVSVPAGKSISSFTATWGARFFGTGSGTVRVRNPFVKRLPT